MNKPERAIFTLSDIRAIRYLELVLGAIAVAMLLFTDRDTPLLVIGFITIVMLVPLVAIYLLRRFGKKNANKPRSRPRSDHNRAESSTSPTAWHVPRDSRLMKPSPVIPNNRDTAPAMSAD